MEINNTISILEIIESVLECCKTDWEIMLKLVEQAFKVRIFKKYLVMKREHNYFLGNAKKIAPVSHRFQFVVIMNTSKVSPGSFWGDLTSELKPVSSIVGYHGQHLSFNLGFCCLHRNLVGQIVVERGEVLDFEKEIYQ